MYDSLADFLRGFSTDFPILWALLVMIVIGLTGLALYGFWELVLRWAARLPGVRSKDAGRSQG